MLDCVLLGLYTIRDFPTKVSFYKMFGKQLEPNWNSNIVQKTHFKLNLLSTNKSILFMSDGFDF